MIEGGLFVASIVEMYEGVNNDLYWDSYIHSQHEKPISFDDWKNRLATKKPVAQEMTKAQAEATLKVSDNILANFVPPTKE